MLELVFETHATSTDNEAGISSGLADVKLSPLGEKQAKDLGERYKYEEFDAIFCSDLQRSYVTGEIAFSDREFPILRDERIRECDYGDLTLRPNDEIEIQKFGRIREPFPDGESYQQCVERVREFLAFLLENYYPGKVMIVGHRAIYYSLVHLINEKSLDVVVAEPWVWQPGWRYRIAT